MANLSRSKVERIHDDLVQYHRKINKLHEELEGDHLREEVCERYSDYKRQLPHNLLEKSAGYLDSRDAKIVFIGTDDYSKSLVINGFLSRPNLMPVNRLPYRIPTNISYANFGKEERLEVAYFDIAELASVLLKKESLKDFLAPFKNQILENPAILKTIFEDYVNSMSPNLGNDLPESKAGDFLKVYDETLAIAEAFSKKISKFGGKYRENLEKKDEILSSETSIESIYAKQAYFYIDNVFLKENRLTFVDLPANYLHESHHEKATNLFSESQCVVVILDVNQLTAKDQLDLFWQKINTASIQERTFFILNGFEKLLKEDLSSNFVTDLIQKIKNKFCVDKLDISHVIFSSTFRVGLAGLMNQPNKTEQDEKTFEELVRNFHEKRQSLSPQLEPAKLDKLKAVYGDGGISQIRNSLLDYVSIEVLFKKCVQAKEQLFQISDMINALIGPEKVKVKDFGAGSSDPIQKILEPVTSTFEKVKLEFDTGFSDLDKVFAKLSAKLNNKLVKAIKGVELKDWNEFIAGKNIVAIDDIVQALLEKCKTDFANDFIQITLSEIKTLIKGRFLGTLERGLFQKKIKLMDEQLETNYTEDYDAFEQAFLAKINWALESKPIELTWSLKKIAIKPKLGDTWTPEVAEQFRNDISTFFVNRYAKLTDDLLDCMIEYLNVYYEQYKAGVNKLMDRMQNDIPKNMEGKKEDKNQIYKKVRRHLKTLGYIKSVLEIDKIRQDLTGLLN